MIKLKEEQTFADFLDEVFNLSDLQMAAGGVFADRPGIQLQKPPWIDSAPVVLNRVDWLFSRAILQTDNLALAYLFFVSRHGSLFLQIDPDKKLLKPDFSDFLISELTVLEKITNWQIKQLRIKFFQDFEKIQKHMIEKRLLQDDLENIKRPIVLDVQKLFLAKNYLYQDLIEKHLFRLNSLQKSGLDLLEKDQTLLIQGLGLSEKQKQAIKNASGKNLSFIWGGPGTGKTFLAAQMCGLFVQAYKKAVKIMALAPTGKAALHLKNNIDKKLQKQNLPVEVVGSTIHAILGLSPYQELLFKDRKSLQADLILVDETSMLDARLLAALLSSVSDHSKLVFLGDLDQLPPVENVDLTDFFRPFAKNMVFLDKHYRFQKDSFARILDSLKSRDLKSFQNAVEHLNIFNKEQTFQVQKQIVAIAFQAYAKVLTVQSNDLSVEQIESKKNIEELTIKNMLENLKNFQLLSPFKVGPLGTRILNHKILEKFREYFSLKKLFRKMPVPIVISQNDYRQNLFNGEIGILFEKAGYFLDENNRIVRIAEFLLPPYELGYVLSVHKSQGSEYKDILLVLPEESEKFGFKLLYTAITRAREKASLFAFENVLNKIFQA